MSTETKSSPVEGIKLESHFLRGPIPEELADGSDHFGKESIQLLKHHGTYQQDDRDVRNAGGEPGGGKRFIFMVRTKIPGGRLTAEQLLEELDLCDELGNTTLRVTTRQGLQLHGVTKGNLQGVIRRINEAHLSTLGACGDVNRNVMCCPGPYASEIYRGIAEFSSRLAEHFAPRSSAYQDIWLTDPDTGVRAPLQQAADPEGYDVEPIYGRVYLPRKFKMGIALPHDNCVDVYTHDLGFLAVTEGERVVGYNLLVGGGSGVTPSSSKTFPALARRMAYVPAEEALAAAEAVVKVQRDFGNRADRKLARLKYLVHNMGLEAFKAKVEEYHGGPLAPPTEHDVHGFNDHLGWEEQGDGRWYYGLNVENGRIRDSEGFMLKTALREICRTLRPGIRLTSHQSILFTNLAAGDRAGLEEILTRHGIPLSESISEARRWSMACVAWPTCGLSITEAERALPGMIDQIEAMLAKLGLQRERFTIRMTGCPNGCARPYNSDIGLVGKARGKYTLFLGGRLLGDRLNFLYEDLVPEEEVAATLFPVFLYYKHARREGETLGDFCHRKGLEGLQAFAQAYAADVARHGPFAAAG